MFNRQEAKSSLEIFRCLCEGEKGKEKLLLKTNLGRQAV